MAQVQPPRMVLHQRHHQVQLHVGRRQPGACREEPAAFGEVAGDEAAPLAAVTPRLLQEGPAAAQRQPGQFEPVRGVAEDEVRVVVQVATDARQVVRHRQAQRLQRGAVADARAHQQLRRLQRPRADEHLARRAQRPTLAALQHLHADRAPAFQQQLQRACAGLHAQVGALAEDGMQVAASDAPALALVLRDLVDAQAHHVVAVEVLAHRMAAFTRGG